MPRQLKKFDLFLQLLNKEITLELRRKSVLAGLALYLFSTIFIYYISFGLHGNISDPLLWSALFWVTTLFAAINTAAKSFISETAGAQIYYYSIADPVSVITAKVVYNFLLCSFFSLVAYLLFAIFFGNPVADRPLFAFTIALVSLGFSLSMTVLSGIVSRTNSNNVLMTVLSFPVLTGILLLAIKITKNCIDGLELAASVDELITLGAINVLMGAVSYLLFPYIWRS
jgi:heme exporter protein B